ncbi:MAG: DUF5340 domain-containing protein [Scytolyngbya sp. HA4215-MV1]|jgi:hypothetical protein|nr:DUF5340 domain-containing protein [Scytolyngbya sp. HA4215-MV1]
MSSIPLPSHIHYELLLQLLERQTIPAIEHKQQQREQVHQLIIMLRKALAQQKQLEQSCQQAGIPIEYRWSLNALENSGKILPTDLLTTPQSRQA